MTQELFKLEYISEDANGKIHGGYKSSGLGAYTHPTRQFGFDQAFHKASL